MSSQVVTLFHEMGHVVHCLCTKAEHSRLSWAWPMVPWPGGVENDFLEVPSMLNEQWAYNVSVLQHVSRHHSSNDEENQSLPAPMANALIATKHVLDGVQWTKFIGMALFDIIAHSGPPPYCYTPSHLDKDVVPPLTGLNLSSLFDAVMSDVCGRKALGPGTHYAASWLVFLSSLSISPKKKLALLCQLTLPALRVWFCRYHLCTGYDAGYYGYLWSEANAYDCYASGFGRGSLCLDHDAGQRYRRAILDPGATLSGPAMLRGFLSREPSVESFVQALAASSSGPISP